MNRKYYVNGNAVRKLEPEPIPGGGRQTQRDLEEIRRRKNRRNAARRNRQRAMYMSRGYVAFLTFCVFLSALAAVGYIYIQSRMSHRVRSISALESQITDLKADNDERYKNITTSVDLEEIKRIAIEELGMDYATEDQIIYYTVDKNNFMDQYQDIPE